MESRKETEKERSDRHREGRLRAWENTHYSAIERRLEKMRSAKIKRNGLTEEPQYTPEQIAEEEKRLYDQMDADRAKAFPELGGNNSGTATPAPTQTSGNDGQDAPRQFKEGDEQEVNGVRMKLLPSKKNPGKLTWQRI